MLISLLPSLSLFHLPCPSSFHVFLCALLSFLPSPCPSSWNLPVFLPSPLSSSLLSCPSSPFPSSFLLLSSFLLSSFLRRPFLFFLLGKNLSVNLQFHQICSIVSVMHFFSSSSSLL